jgi:NAD-dependent SIR2 family protein deacetylase
LLQLNPGWGHRRAEQAPDGDAEVEGTEGFRVADCVVCRGPLKPDVVFFGENVDKANVERAYAMVDASEALLVVGTSLQVFSGYRFVKRAAQRGQPIAVINLGETRGDALATVKVEGRAGEILPVLVRALTG